MAVGSLTWAILLLSAELPAITAKSFLDTNSFLHRRHAHLDDVMRREVNEVFGGELYPREAIPQAPAPSATPGPSNNINFNTPQWNTTTYTACTQVLSKVGKASNPLGMLGCYNIPFLDRKTGVFEADLRLYQISAPTGQFTGVATRDVSIGLLYPAASVSSSTNSVKRSLDDHLTARQNGNPMAELQQFQFIGQINKTLTLTKLTNSQFQSLVIPTVQLSAQSPMTSVPMTVNLTSADTTYFVNGNFADTPGTGPAAAIPTNIQNALTAASAFVLPGTTLGIFPLGFIITGAWTVLFVAAVGWGTYGRVRFRRHYRRRRAKADANANASGWR